MTKPFPPATEPELTRTTLWLMTVASGLVVANIYYNQPLLVEIATTYRVPEAQAGMVAMLTQVGYAVGLLFIIPLGDMLRRKRLILVDFVLIILSLLLAAFAPNIYALMAASLLIGVTSVVPQLFIPMAAHLARPEARGKAVGTVMSGLLIGVLCSRTLSGYVGAHLSWRAMFQIAAGLMVVLWVVLYFLLPEVHPHFKGNYRSLMKSMVHLLRTEPKLRLASARGALSFACFGGFWTTLVFLLEGPPFYAGSDVAGAFGLIGAGGALMASVMGRLSDKFDTKNILVATIALIILSYVVFGLFSYSLIGLILGVVLLDLGLQASHIANQTLIVSLHPQARNRLNTVYMFIYFMGGAIGTILATQAWQLWRWNGVVLVGLIFSSMALIVHLLFAKKESAASITVPKEKIPAE